MEQMRHETPAAAQGAVNTMTVQGDPTGIVQGIQSGADAATLETLRRELCAMEVHNVEDDEEPPSLFRINGVEVLPRQSVGLVAGQRKNGKSNFAGVLMSACLAKTRSLFDGAVCCLVDGPLKVLYVDTEQPKRDSRRTLRRMMATAGYDRVESWDEHGIKVLSIKDVDLSRRMDLVQGAVGCYEPDMVIIDGLADLLRSINDENDSRELWQRLDSIASEHNCVILGMLHQNHHSTKVGGWAGTQGVKKATDLFEVKKNREFGYFSVCHEGRGEGAPRLQFSIVCEAGDNVGRWEALTGPLESLTEEDKERHKLEALVENAPLPCTNMQLVRYVMDAQRYVSKSPADKLLRRAKEMGLLDTRRQGRHSIWFRKTASETDSVELFDVDEADETDDGLLPWERD